MLNIKFIIDNPELVKEGLAKKGYTPEQIDIDALIALHKDVNKLKTSTQALAEEKMANPVLLLGLPDKFIDHGDVSQLLAMHKLDKNGIITSIQERFGKSADTCSIR